MTRSLKTCPEAGCAAAPEVLGSDRPTHGLVSGFLAAVDAALELLVDTLFTWQQRRTDRTRLQTLDDHMLGDIGLSRADVEAEAVKPFWKP